MSDKKEVGHWFANHGLGWSVSEVSREDAIEKLLLSVNTPKDWHRNCLKDGGVLSVYSCYVPVDIKTAYKIEWFTPVVDGVRDGANHMVTYLTQKKCAYMRDPSDLINKQLREEQALREQREQQLRTLAYAIVKSDSTPGDDVDQLLKECFDDEALFPKGEEKS